MTAKVTIVIPSYNKAQFVRDTLQSVLEQTYSNWECLVIDDGSIDDSMLIINEFVKDDNRFVSLLKDENLPKGPSSSRNLGIQKAKGKYVVFLDADDLLSSDCLENRIKLFEENYQKDFLIFQMQRFQSQPDYSIKKVSSNVPDESIIHSFIHLYGVWAITGPIYKTQLLKSVNGFEEKLSNYEDFELAVKVLLKSDQYKIFETVDCYYRNDENYRQKYSVAAARTQMVQSFYNFIQSIDAFLINEGIEQHRKKIIKKEFVSSYKKFFKAIVIEDVKQFSSQNKQILDFFSQRNYLTQWQRISYYFVQRVLFKLNFIKGMGLFRLIKIMYK